MYVTKDTTNCVRKNELLLRSGFLFLWMKKIAPENGFQPVRSSE